jgi:hypothetical protein
VDSLQRQVASLTDSLVKLEQGKSLALQAGYSNAFLGYQGLSERYIAELRKPRFSLGSTLGVCRRVRSPLAEVGRCWQPAADRWPLSSDAPVTLPSCILPDN